LLNADFSSVDSEGRPFRILADQAIQQNNNPDKIQMVKPNGTLKNSEKESISLKGDIGLFEQDKQFLTLNDNVVMTRSDGTVLNTSVLYMNLADSSAQTDQPLTIEGPQGKIWANGMTTTGGGAKTVFTGPAKLIVNSTTTPKGGS
jgi:LPS export ABC transporter protein LptC